MTERKLLELDWTTGASLEDGYPAVLSTGLASVEGVHVVRVRDVIVPDAVRYEAVQVAQWTASGGSLSIGYITGLETARRYLITLEVLGA